MTGFDRVLTRGAGRLVRDDGVVVGLEPQRWRAAADRDDTWMLDRCTGPTVDLGCGPGRLVAALTDRGIPALGVDSSPVARALCRRGGIPMVRRDVFSRLPGEGSWTHALLADGNIGIGGDPVRLLTRARSLLQPDGTVLVEADPDPGEWWCGTARTSAVGADAAAGMLLPWACVGADVLRSLAPAAGLRVTGSSAGARSFVELGVA